MALVRVQLYELRRLQAAAGRRVGVRFDVGPGAPVAGGVWGGAYKGGGGLPLVPRHHQVGSWGFWGGASCALESSQHADPQTHQTSPFVVPPPPNKCLYRYIKERDLDWGYWPLDGQQGPSRELKKEESYGLLNEGWDGFAYPPLIEALRGLP
jgi:hypothetical protein